MPYLPKGLVGQCVSSVGQPSQGASGFSDIPFSIGPSVSNLFPTRTPGSHASWSEPPESPFVSTKRVNLTELYLPLPSASFSSPQIIILRVAMGYAWVKEIMMMNEISTGMAL